MERKECRMSLTFSLEQRQMNKGRRAAGSVCVDSPGYMLRDFKKKCICWKFPDLGSFLKGKQSDFVCILIL